MRRFASLALAALLVAAACSPRQESEERRDVEPEKLVNTDLSYPKNPERWAFVSSRLSTAPNDPFGGYRVVLLNPFAARAREERTTVSRGAKFAQLIYEPVHDAGGVRPGELRRLNLLVQDPERYSATGGWGFASYDANGRAIPVEPRNDCMSCHTSGPVSLPWPE